MSSRLRSFAFAFAGLRTVLVTQPNAWIHAAATALAVGLGLFLGLDRYGWCWLAVAVGLVWIAEAFNTALEALADAASPEPNPLVGRAKDASAGAVLVAACVALVIGLFVLGRPLLARLAS